MIYFIVDIRPLWLFPFEPVGTLYHDFQYLFNSCHKCKLIEDIRSLKVTIAPRGASVGLFSWTPTNQSKVWSAPTKWKESSQINEKITDNGRTRQSLAELNLYLYTVSLHITKFTILAIMRFQEAVY